MSYKHEISEVEKHIVAPYKALTYVMWSYIILYASRLKVLQRVAMSKFNVLLNVIGKAIV